MKIASWNSVAKQHPDKYVQSLKLNGNLVILDDSGKFIHSHSSGDGEWIPIDHPRIGSYPVLVFGSRHGEVMKIHLAAAGRLPNPATRAFTIHAVRTIGTKVFCLIESGNSLVWNFWTNTGTGTRKQLLERAYEFYTKESWARTINFPVSYYPNEARILRSPRAALNEINRKKAWKANTNRKESTVSV